VAADPLVSDAWIMPPGAAGGEQPPPPGECGADALEARREWFRRHRGALAGGQDVYVEVVNDSDRTMAIEGLQIEHLEAIPAIKGTSEALCPRGGGGDFGTQYARLELDRRPPQFRYFDETYQPVPAVQFAPEPHQPLRFWIQAVAEERRYRWTAVLVYSLDGKRQEARIDDGGKPFDVTGCSDLRQDLVPCGPPPPGE
jgi:hypothetical protein